MQRSEVTTPQPPPEGHDGDTVAARAGEGRKKPRKGREGPSAARRRRSPPAGLRRQGSGYSTRGLQCGSPRRGFLPRVLPPLSITMGFIFPTRAAAASKKRRPVLDALQVEHHCLGQLINLEGLHVIFDGDHRLVSRTGEGADADPLVFRESPGVAPRDFPTGRPARWLPGLGRTLDPQQIERRRGGCRFPSCWDRGSGYPQLSGLPDQILFQLPSPGAGLCESGRNQENVSDLLSLSIAGSDPEPLPPVWSPRPDRPAPESPSPTGRFSGRRFHRPWR